jgi:hypothetical protein
VRLLLVIGGCALALALAALSLPWVAWALGCAVLGDDDVADRAVASCPLSRYLDWVRYAA